MQLEPDDVLVLNCPFDLSPADAEQRLKDLERLFPRHKAVILYDGVKLGVVSA